MKIFNSIGCAFSAIFGSIFALIGAGIALASLHALPFHIDTSGLPPFFGALFGTMFFLAGVKTISSGVAQLHPVETPFIQYSQQALSILILLLFGSLFFWAGMQGGEASFFERLPFLAVGAGVVLWGLWMLSGLLNEIKKSHGNHGEANE